MSVQLVQAAGTVFLAAVGGVTIGQYQTKRKALRALDFGRWRDGRFMLLVLLALAVVFAPEIVSHKHEWLMGLFD